MDGPSKDHSRPLSNQNLVIICYGLFFLAYSWTKGDETLKYVRRYIYYGIVIYLGEIRLLETGARLNMMYS